MKQRVRGGTPDHGVNLCLSCESSVVRRGHRVSEEEMFCHALGTDDGPGRVPYVIAECSAYRDKGQSKAGMFYQTAWVLVPDVGFLAPDEVRRRRQKGEAIP